VKFYKNKRVFITGHTGFKGAWLLSLLNSFESNISGYARQTKNESDIYNLIKGDKICKSFIGDITNFDLLKNEVSEFQPDIIFHLAAQPLVKYSYNNPLETYNTNIQGTINLLECLKTINNKCAVVLITTDKVYQNNEWEFPYREIDRLGGYDPYSSSKACCELIINAYRNSFFNLQNINNKVFLCSVRAGNVIGGGDWSEDRIIPDIVRSILNNKPLELRNPSSIRPWQHVLEPILGYLMLAYKLYTNPNNFSQSYNFGPNLEDALSVQDVVKLAYNNWPYLGKVNYSRVINEQHETKTLKLDISKVKNDLSWTPTYNAQKAIQITMDWYRNYQLKKTDVDIFTKNQIEDFLNTVKNKYELRSNN
jgi:CDP-glucose 4,6-dehydratase